MNTARPIASALAAVFAAALSATLAEAEGLAPSARIETSKARGLAAPGEIIIDHWGVAHIYAASARDAFFLQGYNAARDRLWQIDLWRKRGLGRLSASFGPDFVDKDRAARLFLYRGDMAAEWAAYPKDAKAWTEAFVAGINAYVNEVKSGDRPLPVEFGLTSSLPETWTADDVVRIRSHALVGNLASEILRAQSVCKGGLPYETLRRKIEPVHKLSPPKGGDLCAVESKALGDYLLATTPVAFDGKQVKAEAPSLVQLAKMQTDMTREGSNNWIVAADHSVTGRPILANDPHREHSVPSLRYLVHLDAPDLHLIGAGEPALPGVSFGHNDEAAWGLTIFYADQQDLYTYDTSPKRPDMYRYQGRWTPMEVVRDKIAVKGGPDREVTLRFTRHGPVIGETPASRKAFAVRSIWSLPGAAGYFNATWMFRAKSWGDFETAHAHWGAPPLNLVYADVHGDTGWLPSAFAPSRPNWDGLFPVPGDGRYEWKGLTAPNQFPAVKNPAKGWLATANEMNLPKDYPAEQTKLGYEWVDRSRIDEIEARLAEKPKLSLTDMMAIQTDATSPLARRAAGLLKGLSGDDADQRAGLALLKDWDGSERAESAQAALFEIWANGPLRSMTVAAVVPASARPAFADPQLAAVIDWLSAPNAAFGPSPPAARDAILTASIGKAWREAVQRLGPDPARWRWGDLHLAQWTPAAAALAEPALKAQMSVGPLQLGGSGSTPMATSYRASDYHVIAGASVRMVMDVGAWDNSVVINTPGQSGDPMSPHYRDLFPLWASGAYAPMLYSRSAVLAQAEKVMRLTPGK